MRPSSSPAGEVLKEYKKAAKHDAASRLAAVLNEEGREGVLATYEATPEFQEAWKVKARDVMARAEWRRRKLTKRVGAGGCCTRRATGVGPCAFLFGACSRPAGAVQPRLLCHPPPTPSTAHPLRHPPHWLAQIAEEEERAKAEFKEERDVAKARAQHDKAWEKSREERVGSWRDFAQKKMKVARGAGGLKPPKQKESDAEKRYVQRAVGEQWRPGTHKPPKR